MEILQLLGIILVLLIACEWCKRSGVVEHLTPQRSHDLRTVPHIPFRPGISPLGGIPSVLPDENPGYLMGSSGTTEEYRKNLGYL